MSPGIWRLQVEFEDCNLCSNALILSGDKQVDYQPWHCIAAPWWSECLGKAGWSIELWIELRIACRSWFCWSNWHQLLTHCNVCTQSLTRVWNPELANTQEFGTQRWQAPWGFEQTPGGFDLWTFDHSDLVLVLWQRLTVAMPVRWQPWNLWRDTVFTTQ